jgi:IS30 family transposase
MSYSELSVEERATIQIGHAQGLSLRKIACLINRSPSTISREVRRNRDVRGCYSARVAQQQMQASRQVCRPTRTSYCRGASAFSWWLICCVSVCPPSKLPASCAA